MADKKVKAKTTKAAFYETIWGWAFALPTMIGLIVLNIYPIFNTIYQSFFKTGDFGKGNIFVGLQNYQKVFADGEVWRSLGNTFKYAILEVPLSVIIALVLAVLLNRKMKGRSFYRTVIFLPMVAAPAAVAMVWRWLYNADFGLLNNVLGTSIRWVSDPKVTIYSIAIIGIWSVVGYNMVLFLSGLQEIPRDYYEAAEIDGATGVKAFFNITLPLLSPTIYFVLVTRIISAMQVFDMIFLVIEKSNPAFESVQSLVYLFYNYTFEQKNNGYGATIVIVLLVVIMILTAIQKYGEKKWVFYN